MKKYLIIALLSLIASSLEAQIKIKGQVIDSDNIPLIGVSVAIQNSSTGTITDLDGYYSIEVKDPKTILTFSYIGYQNQEISIGTKRELNVQLLPTTTQIDEVVVIGYGTSRKKDLTGAVATIKSDLLEDKMLFSLDDALQGGVAGLLVSSSSGQPGAASSILIRGASSLSGSTNPLIVVDGAPMFDVETNIGGGSQDAMSGLSMINPADIASIEVLKDVSATSIYGNRGANGVILITTKKGKTAGCRVNYSTYFGAQNLSRKYEVMDFNEYAYYQQQVNKSNNLFTNPASGKAYVFDTRTPSKDWQDEIYRTGFIQNHNASLQYSKDQTNMIGSVSYMQNKSVLIETNWQKLTGKIGIDHSFGKKVKVGIDMNYSRIQDNGIPTGGEGVAQNAGVIMQALTARPYDLKDPNTQVFFRRAGILQSIIDSNNDNYKGNPVNIAKKTELSKELSKTSINAYFQANLYKDLVLKITGYWDDFKLSDKQFYPYETPKGRFHNTLAVVGNINSTSWVNENTITWSPIFNRIHRINLLGGFSEQGFIRYMNRNEISDFEYEELGFNNLQLGRKFNSHSNKGQTRFLSGMFRGNYVYDDRYIATVTYRRDGSSSFVNNKWGNFFSGALAWNIIEEKFMKEFENVSMLKLRGSYGEVGNSNVPSTGAYSQLYNTQYPFGDDCAIGQSAASIANEDLTWETTREFNAGVEYGMYNNRITLNFDFYNKVTYDLLLEAPVVNIVGFNKAWQNVGNLRNRGFEISLNSLLVETKKIKWDFNLNFSKNISKITKLGNNGDPIFLNIPCLGNKPGIILKEGSGIGEFFGYVTEGVYGLSDFHLDGKTPRPGVATETGKEKPGHMRFKDLNGDGKITADDRTLLGSSQPKFYGAFGSSFTYKNWNLNLGFQYSYGAKVYNANYSTLAKFNSEQHNQMEFWNNRWTETNSTSTLYSAMTADQICSAFLEDASFLRFKTLKLTYSLPSSIFKKKFAFIGNLKVYASADNIYCFTKYSGYDPEVSSNQSQGMAGVLSSGFDYGTFPRATTISIGLNLSI